MSEPKKKDTARTCILRRLEGSMPLAVHELDIHGHSQNALATELSVMARLGLVGGRYRPTKRFKEWFLTSAAEQAA